MDETTSPSSVERDRQLLASAEGAGFATRLKTYLGLSGPGWVQSAVTLGGGSLASALYLGVLGGYSFMWLQPLAMIIGVVMLSVIGYVTLSTGEKPFPAINNHVSPVLGWSWAIAVAMANVIWCMPQHSLAYGVLSKNLLPSSWFGSESALTQWAVSTMGPSQFSESFDKFAIATLFLFLCVMITWSYDRGGWGIRLYESVLKAVVGLIVLCFFGVVLVLSFSDQPLAWGAVFAGLVPDFSQFFRPAETFLPLLDAVGEPGDARREFWTNYIVTQQRDVIIAAAATAVGINMTFLYPYSMLRKGWTKEFRGLAVFDLSTGMFIPFILATGCVVIAAAATFHTQLPTDFQGEDGQLVIDEASGSYGAYKKILGRREASLGAELGAAAVPAASEAEQRLAATLVKRNAADLSKALAPLTGPAIANFVFGFGVLAMVLSTISVLMLMSGTVIAEMLACPPGGWAHKIGTLVAGIGGVMWPFIWTGGDSQFYLAVVASVFGFMLLPFAYITFAALFNSKSLLGDEMVRGPKRWLVNLLIFSGSLLVTVGAVYIIFQKLGIAGVIILGCFGLLTGVVAINQRNTRLQAATD